MKSKAPLLLMEQMVMLVVFALAAALCVQAFVRSDGASRRNEARDRAVVLCQNAAELIQHSGDVEAALTELHGEVYEDNGSYHSFYDEDMNYIRSQPGCGMEAPETVYRLEVTPVDAGVGGLGKARVEVVSIQDGTSVFAIEVAWQEEVADHG